MKFYKIDLEINMEFKNKTKFTVNPQSILFQFQNANHKFIVKNTSLRTESYEITNPNQQHYNIQSSRKFTLAPGMSQACYVSHIKCQKCHKDEFNKIRITNSQKQTYLVNLECPQIIEQEIRLISCLKQINFGEFNFDMQKKFNIPIKNLALSNLKLSISYQSQVNQLFNIQFEESELILLKNRQINVKGKLNFRTGTQFIIKLLINITSEQNLCQISKSQVVTLIGNSLIKNQSVKNSNGKVIESLNLKILNGTSTTGQFMLSNNFRKDCLFKLAPEISSSNPNQFSSKWIESQIQFSQETGQLKAFQNKKISFQIKTTPNSNDLNFVEKFSKIEFNDDINFSKMKSSKYFRKNVDINIKVVFIEKQIEKNENTTNFKIRLNIVNPALKILYKSHSYKEVFQVHNQSQLKVPFEISNHTLYKINPSKGVFDTQKTVLIFQWKSSRPQTASKKQASSFSLAYGKCNLFIGLPKLNLQIYNFVERQNLRPMTSTIRKNLGLDKSSSMMLKRPLSALCNQMIAKKLKLVRQEDFYQQIPKFLAIDYLKNEDLQKLVVSSSQKGNIISNTWNKQISVYFSQKGHLILKPIKAYLLPYQLNLSNFYINDQQFHLSQPLSQGLAKTVLYNNKGKQETYILSSRQISFAFTQLKKDYQIQNNISITNVSKQTFKAFLLTVQDEYFTSGEQENKIIVHPQETVNFRIKLFPKSSNKKQNKISRKLQFLINGNKEVITCNGELLPVQCDYSPKELKFTDSHFGEEQTIQTIVLSNTGFNKLSYQVYCPNYVNVNYLQNSGTISGKGNASISVKFKPTTYLQNHKDHIKILIRGSHAFNIPLLINTKKPNVVIVQNLLDFGQGIIGDFLECPITLQNRNKTISQCRINLKQTNLFFQDNTVEKNVILKADQRKNISLKTKVTTIGVIRHKLETPLAEIPGFGSIQSPTAFNYIGKQNIVQITPSCVNQCINIEDTQSSFKLKLQNLIGQKVELRAELISDKKYDQTFIMSIQPNNLQLAPYSQKQLSLNSLISDLQKLTEEQRNYSLQIFRKGYAKPYTTFKFNVKLPTPKLIISPSQLYFPIISVGTWNHLMFKIVNKGYKEIHFKIKKPTNINFELQVVQKISTGINIHAGTQNKLTKLNNQAEIRVSFKSKSPISFQNHLEIEDNFGNVYTIKFYGLTTTCPLLLTETTGSMPISTKSIPSTGSMPQFRTFSTISGGTKTQCDNQDHQIEHAKFFNYWVGTFMPYMKKQNSFHQYLSKPDYLIQFLQYFGVQVPKTSEKMKLSDIIFQLRKIDIPLDIIDIRLLEKNVLSEWIKFMYIFLSTKYMHPDCLKWLSKVSNQNIQSYEVAHNNYKKIIATVLNGIFFKVFKVKINQYEKILQRFDPFFQFLFKIESKKHLIVSLNILYHKLSKFEQSQIVKSEQLNHKINVSHNSGYQRTVNWIISDGTPEILSNSGGTNIHTNISDCGYYFSLDKTHPDTEIKLGLKQKVCIAILNSTLFEKCTFIQYQLEQIKPKIHNVVIQCEDKFTQEWLLQYQAPVDSQYKIDLVGDPQLKCRFNSLGLIKVGKRIPITITYSPNNLNSHIGTLTILNKHFSQIYMIKGKALFSQNIEYEKQIRLCQGKRQVQIIEIPWQHVGNKSERNDKKDRSQSKKSDKIDSQVPSLSLIEYNEKRKEFLSHNLTIQKQNKKQCLVRIKLEYLFDQPIKKLALLYQITNEDQTQSKIIRIIVKVVPKPINIQAEIKCKLQQFVIQKLPLQNNSDQKQMVYVEFFKNTQQIEKYQKNGSESSLRTDRYDLKSSPRNANQFKLSKTGKVYLQSGQLENIHLTYRPDSLFQTFCQIRVTYQQSQCVVNYKFKGIPQFPSSHQELVEINCSVQELKVCRISLKSLVRQTTTFQVETNIKQISGKDKISLGSGQIIQYPFQIFCYHAGIVRGEIIFKSPQVTLIYPVLITVEQNNSLAKKYRINSRVRHSTILQLQLHNKSCQDITYDIFCNHQYLICPNKFFIEKGSKKVLQATYLPFTAGQYTAQIKLYHPDLKQIVYQLEMKAQAHQQTIYGSQLQLLSPYQFVLPIKNTTLKDCLIQRPILPLELNFKKQDSHFPIHLAAGKTHRFELSFKQNLLKNILDETIVIKTDCIGQYKFNCKLNLLEYKNMQNIDIHYQTSKNIMKIDAPFKANFVNGFNQKLKFNIEFKGYDNKILNSINLKSPQQFSLQPFQTVDIQGNIKVNLPKAQKSLMSIDSSQDLQTPTNLTIWTVKQKIRYQFIYPIKLIRIYENPQTITVKANAYQVKRTLINLAVVKDVSRWLISDLTQEFVKSSFGFTSLHLHQNFLQTIINKPFKYQGFITFYNLKNQAEKIPLKIEIGEPKYEPIVISSNVGQKSALQIQLKNGKGPFKVQLTNNKTQQFDVQPKQGAFQQIKGQSVAKINFLYFPNEYSGIKRAKVAITSQQGCYYFNLMGKFKSLKKA